MDECACLCMHNPSQLTHTVVTHSAGCTGFCRSQKTIARGNGSVFPSPAASSSSDPKAWLPLERTFSPPGPLGRRNASEDGPVPASSPAQLPLSNLGPPLGLGGLSLLLCLRAAPSHLLRGPPGAVTCDEGRGARPAQGVFSRSGRERALRWNLV